MLTEEAHHLSVGETGIQRVLQRAADLTHQDPNGDVRAQGGIDFATVQKFINYWFSYSLDLFGSEISSNAADYFAAGLKGRYREAELWTDHVATEGRVPLQVLRDGRLATEDVPLRNAMNELLRAEYRKDCERVVKRWNRTLEEANVAFRVVLPDSRFHRRQGIYAGIPFDPAGQPISADEWARRQDEWLPTDADRAYVASLMHPVYEPGKMANWIAAPGRGIDGKPVEFEYVRRT
jgi:benzoyl-CoA 2,3-dioxygenase component B